MVRRVRFFALVMTFGLLLSACTWPMFRFGPDHTGVNPVVTKVNTSNVGTFTLKGTGATGGAVFSSPALANGVVYVGSTDGKLYAFDQYGQTNCSGSPKTCTPLWTAATGGQVFSSPAVVNGVVYVGSVDNKLYAFDAAAGSATCSGIPKTCTPLWTAATGAFVRSSPTVVNGVVYVGSDKLYAFDTAGGSATCSGTPKTCTPLWTANFTDEFVDASAAVANGVVYVGTFPDHVGIGKLYAFDAAGSTNCSGTPKTCTPLWTAIGGGRFDSSPAVANGIVYVGSYGGNLYAFDAATGATLWTATISTGGFPFSQSSPAVANGVVYVGSEDSKVYAFDAAGRTNCWGTPKTCTPLWTATTGGSVDSSPAIENGIVFVGSNDHNLYAFDAAGSINCSGTPKNCTALWSAPTFAAVESSPAPGGNAVYVGSFDGNVYAFGLP